MVPGSFALASLCLMQHGGEKEYANCMHTHTRIRMVLLTHASNTPRLGDTGRYGNVTLVDSQVSQFPLGGSRAVGEV